MTKSITPDEELTILRSQLAEEHTARLHAETLNATMIETIAKLHAVISNQPSHGWVDDVECITNWMVFAEEASFVY